MKKEEWEMVNKNLKSCNTCLKGAMHHFASAELRGFMAYKCPDAPLCRNFDRWTAHREVREGVLV